MWLFYRFNMSVDQHATPGLPSQVTVGRLCLLTSGRWSPVVNPSTSHSSSVVVVSLVMFALPPGDSVLPSLPPRSSYFCLSPSTLQYWGCRSCGWRLAEHLPTWCTGEFVCYSNPKSLFSMMLSSAKQVACQLRAQCGIVNSDQARMVCDLVFVIYVSKALRYLLVVSLLTSYVLLRLYNCIYFLARQFNVASFVSRSQVLSARRSLIDASPLDVNINSVPVSLRVIACFSSQYVTCLFVVARTIPFDCIIGVRMRPLLYVAPHLLLVPRLWSSQRSTRFSYGECPTPCIDW